MTKEQRQELKDWYTQYTIEQIVEAYHLEVDRNKRLTEIIHTQEKEQARLRYNLNKLNYEKDT